MWILVSKILSAVISKSVTGGEGGGYEGGGGVDGVDGVVADSTGMATALSEFMVGRERERDESSSMARGCAF